MSILWGIVEIFLWWASLVLWVDFGIFLW